MIYESGSQCSMPINLYDTACRGQPIRGQYTECYQPEGSLQEAANQRPSYKKQPIRGQHTGSNQSETSFWKLAFSMVLTSIVLPKAKKWILFRDYNRLLSQTREHRRRYIIWSALIILVSPAYCNNLIPVQKNCYPAKHIVLWSYIIRTQPFITSLDESSDWRGFNWYFKKLYKRMVILKSSVTSVIKMKSKWIFIFVRFIKDVYGVVVRQIIYVMLT